MVVSCGNESLTLLFCFYKRKLPENKISIDESRAERLKRSQVLMSLFAPETSSIEAGIHNPGLFR